MASSSQKVNFRLIHHCRYCPDSVQYRVATVRTGASIFTMGWMQRYIGDPAYRNAKVTRAKDWEEAGFYCKACVYCGKSFEEMRQMYEDEEMKKVEALSK